MGDWERVIIVSQAGGGAEAGEAWEVVTPLGSARILWSGEELLGTELPRPDSQSGGAVPAAGGGNSRPAADGWPWALARDLRDYFAGTPVDLSPWWTRARRWDLTPFRLKVYERVLAIPRGQVMTYGQVAEAVGSPGASRAVGGAMAANPFAPIVPCHRVVAAGGGLGGYGGGLPMKARLLAMEGRRC